MKSTNISIWLLYHDFTLAFSPRNVTMLFVLVVCHLVVASIANPISKYPFVFLLDVGNEELEKTNTEQIRVCIPGGSLAVRYPAVDDGSLITHVRVTGIDYGTDLKANIVEGGPGYKYVVLVFFGNTGVPYEAVVTLETQPNTDMDTKNVIYNKITEDSNQTSNEEDENNSAEDTDDDVELSNSINDGEQLQSSENIYNYASVAGNDHDNDGSVNSNIDSEENNDANEEDVEDEKSSEDKIEDNQYRAEKLQARSNNDYIYYSKYKNSVLDSNEIEGTQLDEDARMYRQDALNDNTYSGGETVELDQMFNDEEVHNDADKYRDSNNNNFDSDYDSAVAY